MSDSTFENIFLCGFDLPISSENENPSKYFNRFFDFSSFLRYLPEVRAVSEIINNLYFLLNLGIKSWIISSVKEGGYFSSNPDIFFISESVSISGFTSNLLNK